MKQLELVTDIKEDKDGNQELVTEAYNPPIFVKGSMVKKAISLGVKLEKSTESISSEVVDELAAFAVELYGNKFTAEELIDGIDAKDLMNELMGILTSVMGGDDNQDAVTHEKKLTEVKND